MSTRTLTEIFKIDGALTDMGSVTLADAANAYGIKRNDTGGVVVAAGTAMSRTALGTYVASFTEPAPGLSYTCALKVIYGGQTYYADPFVIAASPTPAAAIYDGVEIDANCNYPFAKTFSVNGLDSSGWTEFVFTIKRCADIASDAAALVAVKVSNPAAGTDGLFTLNGAPPASPAGAADGAITVNGTAVNTEVALVLTARGMAIPPGAWAWELTRWSGGASTKYLVGRGDFIATQVVRRSPVAV